MKKKESEEIKLMRHRIQYTKIAMNVVLTLVVVLSLGSLYINLKTGNSMDLITVEAWQSLWKCISVYCVKSFAENFTNKLIDAKFTDLIKDSTTET